MDQLFPLPCKIPQELVEARYNDQLNHSHCPSQHNEQQEVHMHHELLY